VISVIIAPSLRRVLLFELFLEHSKDESVGVLLGLFLRMKAILCLPPLVKHVSFSKHVEVEPGHPHGADLRDSVESIPGKHQRVCVCVCVCVCMCVYVYVRVCVCQQM
jgi:hypothetical protein